MARETVTIEGLGALLRRLQAFPKEMSARGGPVRAGVRKGAMVIVKEMQANVDRIIADPNVTAGEPSSGLLRRSVATFRSKARAGERGETYVVTVKRGAKYSEHRIRGRLLTARVIGQRLEYGTSKRKPMPWARPAFHAKKEEAARVMVAETEKGVAKIEKKLATTIR